MKWRERNLLNLLLLVGIALLLLGIVNIWWGGSREATGTRSAKGPEVPLAPVLRDQQPLSAFAVVAEKNLFSQDRKGHSLKQGKSSNSLEGCQLLGTIIIGHTRAALIQCKAESPGRGGGDVEVVRLGEEWGGYKVVEVSNAAVIFQGKNGRRTLNFPE